jgi:hypothetical protein
MLPVDGDHGHTFISAVMGNRELHQAALELDMFNVRSDSTPSA